MLRRTGIAALLVSITAGITSTVLFAAAAPRARCSSRCAGGSRSVARRKPSPQTTSGARSAAAACCYRIGAEGSMIVTLLPGPTKA
jgi:hypothetical protein